MAEVNTLVVRKPCFGLPTGCPQCLSAYIYLKFAQIPFHLDFHLNHPHSDQIPYFEVGDYVAYSNEKDSIIECLKKDIGVVDLDSGVSTLPDWISTKAMLTTWLADALDYELWVGCEGSSAYSIYYSDLPWPIRKVLFWKKAHWVKQKHGITNDNAVVKKEEIYGRANSAYDSLSNWLGEQNYLFENRPSSLDAIFLAHGLVVLQALPESSMLRTKFLEHANLVRYVQQCKTELIEAGTSPSSGPQFHTDTSSSTSRSHSTSSSKPKSKPKREKTKEEKTFKKRAKYFVVAQMVAVVVFLTLMTTFDDAELEVDDGDGGYDYDV
ncbi:mitochondrial outer membrane import complex protein METAXIN-like isoform X2 [Gastrolobium bilobum]|uniref:mitochondrial outer membrane import complex protein METAXIN-like isoform X2 n=1 Tax=Gastrolobium bilobum TaxID=150636 RepID=UPI002AB1B94E|nr:mitochondrial outer membrane import complex protein METAXIN-like isoform X2 [Gastrolobium bilobum]